MSSDSSSDQVLFLDGNVSPAILSAIFGFNVSYLYSEAQKGRLPQNLTELTYRQAIQHYVNYWRKDQEYKIAKLEAETRRKEEEKAARAEEKKRRAVGLAAGIEDDSIHPLVAAKMKQDVRLGRAREEQLLQKNAIERGDYISTEKMAELVEPLVIQLRGSLLALADISSEHEKLIDGVMQDIYNLGVKLLEEAEKDAKEYVTLMMEREIEFDD